MFKKLLVMLVVASALTLSAAFTANAAVVAGNTGWFWSNPLPQGNTLTKVDTIAGRTYVAGSAGAIMRSDNGGASWTGIRSGLPAAKSDVRIIRAVTPDTVIFAGACGLRRTDDAGATVRRLPWSSTDVSCPATIASLSFPTSTIGYLLLSNGDILQTQDGGDSWRRQTAAPGTPAGNPPGGAAVNDIWFTTATSGVISVGNQIYYTTDSGSSWTPVQAVNGQGFVQFEFLSATEGFAIGNSSSLYKTIDGGATWSAVASDGTTNGISIGQLSCSDANTCLATTGDGAKIVRTIDGAANWTVVTASSRPIYGVGFTSAAHAVAVGASGATVTTDDSGANWASGNLEVLGTYYYVHVDGPASAVLYGSGTTLARTTDTGTTWKSITSYSQGTVRDATFPTATRGYALSSLNELTRSDDGGITWKVLDLAGARPTSLYAPDGQTLLLIGGKGVRRSADGGISFKSVGGKSFKKLKLSKADAAGSAIAAWGTNAAVMSKSGGKNWTKVTLPKIKKKTVSLKALDFVDAKNGWIVDTSNEMWTTTKGGGKWTRVETTGLSKIASMSRTDSKHGYLTDGSGSIFVTSDGGKTWAQQSPFLSTAKTATVVAPLSARGAILLVPGTNRILTTATFGQIGTPSKLTINASSKKVKKNSTVNITGKLAPSQGGEQVTVVGRPLNAKAGAKWTYQTATVSLGGTFTTTWKIGQPMIFVAYWAGDATHDGDGADAITIKLNSKKKKK